MKRELVAIGMLAILVGGSLDTSHAQGFASYNVIHNFSLTPKGPRGQRADTYVVGHRWYDHAVAAEPFAYSTSTGTVLIPGTGGVKDVTTQAFANGAEAEAHSFAGVNAFAPPGAITGTVRADGFAYVGAGGHYARAASSSEVRAIGGNTFRNGRVVWGPVLGTGVSGRAWAHKRDPISFIMTDLTTNLDTTGTLLDIFSEVGSGGTFDWDSGASTFVVTAPTTFDFTIDLTSPFVIQQGMVDFHVVNGLVVTSNATGMFAGLFPTVGSSGSFSTALGPISFDYDLMGDPNHDVNVTFDLGGSGEATAVPEPGTMALLVGAGVSGLFVIRRRRN